MSGWTVVFPVACFHMQAKSFTAQAWCTYAKWTWKQGFAHTLSSQVTEDRVPLWFSCGNIYLLVVLWQFFWSCYFKGLGLKIIQINFLLYSHILVDSFMILSVNALVVWVTVHHWGSKLWFCLVKVFQRRGEKIWPLITVEKWGLCFEGFVQKFPGIVNCMEINFLSKQEMMEISLEFNFPFWENCTV